MEHLEAYSEASLWFRGLPTVPTQGPSEPVPSGASNYTDHLCQSCPRNATACDVMTQVAPRHSKNELEAERREHSWKTIEIKSRSRPQSTGSGEPQTLFIAAVFRIYVSEFKIKKAFLLFAVVRLKWDRCPRWQLVYNGSIQKSQVEL